MKALNLGLRTLIAAFMWTFCKVNAPAVCASALLTPRLLHRSSIIAIGLFMADYDWAPMTEEQVNALVEEAENA